MPATPTNRVGNGILQAPGRNKLIEPPIRNAIPRMRKDETCVNRVLINASVLHIAMAVSARKMPVLCSDVVFMYIFRWIRFQK